MASADKNTNYRLVNPERSDDYFDSGATAYDNQDEFDLASSTQPTINDGRVKGVRTDDISSGLLNGVIPGYEPDAMVGTGPKEISNTVAKFAELSNFAYLQEGHYVMRRVTNLINGDASVSANLRSAGSDYGTRRGIHQRQSVRTSLVATAIRNGEWVAYSGAFQAGFPAAQDDYATWTTNGTDDAANPTSSVPGELVYQHGSGEPLQDNYKPQYLW